jgi:enoyl-[acyl-carrier protein] reductase I
MLQQRVVLVTGISNARSLAAAAARACAAAGAQLIATWQDERRWRGVAQVLAEVQPDALCCQLDVTRPETVASCLAQIRERYGRLDGVLHAMAHARLGQRVLDVADEDYQQALAVSARSLAQVVQAAEDLLSDGSKICTLTYQGSRYMMPGYNLMGVAKAALEASVRYLAWELGQRQIHVNAVSAGSVRTAAASAVPGFKARYQAAAERAPLRRNVQASEVGRAVCWLLSPFSDGITGQVIAVDAGVSSVGA